MVRADRQPRRHQRGRLHRQPGDRLPLGDRAAQPRRAAEQRAARLGRDRWADSPATGLLAAERHRTRDGRRAARRGSRSPTSRSRWSGNLGRIAEAQLGGQRPAEGRQLSLRRVRPRLRDPRRPPGDGRRADRPPVGRAASRSPDLREPCAAIERGDRPRPRHRDRPLRGARPDRARCCGRGSRRATLPRDPRGVRGHRRLVGAVPDLPPAGRRGPALLDRQRDVVEEVEHPGVGSYLMPGTPLDFSAGRAHAGAAGAAARRAHRAGTRRPARAQRRGDRAARRGWRRWLGRPELTHARCALRTIAIRPAPR